MRLKTSLLALLVLGLTGCSSGARKARNAFRSSFATQDFKKSLELLENKKIKQDQNSLLLYWMEKGLVHHTMKDYFQSILALRKAEQLAQELYTKSVSKAIASGISNDNSLNYYGTLYERSLIYAYLALNHLLISQQGYTEGFEVRDPQTAQTVKVEKQFLELAERRRELQKARSHVMAWDSLLKASRGGRRGKKVFKQDLFQKILGASIHEMMNTRTDGQIALQLYKDAHEILFKNYSAYAAFNVKYEIFQKNYSRLSRLSKSQIKKKYVLPSLHQQKTLDFILYKILLLTQRWRAYEWNSMLARYSPSEAVMKRVKKQPSQVNFTFLLQNGMVSPKVADKYDISLSGALKSSRDPVVRSLIVQVGAPVLMHYALDVLKLRPDRYASSNSEALLGTVVGSVAAHQAGITFELPKIKRQSIQGQFRLEVYDQAGKLVQQVPVCLVQPLGDIAEETVAYNSQSDFIKTGARVALKHAGAIAASYLTYKAMTKDSEGMAYFARSAAVAQYLLLARAIEASEKADVRFWSSLPNDYRMAELSLPPGEYKLKLSVDGRMDASETKTIVLEDVQILSQSTHHFVTHRLTN